MLEQEVKLQFPDVEAARRVVITAGGRLVADRRLLEDRLFDTVDARLRQGGLTLRVRHDDQRAFLTFKGVVIPGPVKSREELETLVDDATVVEAVLARLGFRETFRLQKLREEYDLASAHLAIDDTPVGVFVEIEAMPHEIARVAALLGRSQADYLLESYATLWRRRRQALGLPEADMLIDGLGTGG